MPAVYLDPAFNDREFREAIFQGQLVLRSPSEASLAFVAHARAMIEEAFAGMDPALAQYQLSVERFVDLFAPLKSAFIHDPASLRCVAAIAREAGCDPDETYIDVPRLRVATSDGYLTSGVAYAHHPHRDTWYSAPMAQINHWLPIYDYAPCAGMAFHPAYWNRPVRNSSAAFDYYRWNAEGRARAREHVRSDTRPQPRSEEALVLQPDLQFVQRPGAVLSFAAAQLHSTCENVSGFSRWSIDFRTVNLSDLVEGRAAPNVDSEPTGTSLRDFACLRDFGPVPKEVIRAYDSALDVDGELVFGANGSGN